MMRGMLTPSSAIFALLFASNGPLEKKELMGLLGFKETELRIALDALSDSLKDSGVAVVETTHELELRTAPEAAALVKKLHESELARDLGKASLETLAVIAYEEGATRGEIDWVRGVNSSASVRTLLMRGLIEGREDAQDKRRIRYDLTTEALAYLGLSSAQELPRHTELARKAKSVIEEEAIKKLAADADA